MESSSFDALRRRVQQRGVRVDERLALLALLAADDAEARLDAEERRALEDVRRAEAELRREAGLP